MKLPQRLKPSRLGLKAKAIGFIVVVIIVPYAATSLYSLYAISEASLEVQADTLKETTALVQQDLLNSVVTKAQVYDLSLKHLTIDLESIRATIVEAGFKDKLLTDYFYRHQSIFNAYYVPSTNRIVLARPVAGTTSGSAIDPTSIMGFSAISQGFTGKWSGPYVDPKTNVQIMSYLLPVWQDSRFMGMLGFDVKTADLLTKIAPIDPSRSSYVFMVRSTHEVISVGDQVFTDLDLAKSQSADITASSVVRDRDNADLFLDANKRQGIFMLGNHTDKQKVVAIANVPSFGGKLVVVSPVGEIIQLQTEKAQKIQTSVRGAGLTVFGYSGILGLLIIVAAYFIAQNVIVSIRRMTTAASEIAAGNLDQQVSVKSSDEIGRLGQALNKMAVELKGLYGNLEAKVRERTKELQATQTQLLENVKQDEALLASIGDGVIATDRSGHVLWINKPAEDMLQMAREEVLGKTYEAIWQLESDKGEPIKEEEQPIYQAYNSGKPVRNSDYSYVRKDADGKVLVKFAVAVTVAPVTLNNQIIGIINVFRDITHERQVDRMKTEFISLASHQLRTPLSAIRWFSEMLVSGDAGKLVPEQEDFAKNIFDSANRMIELVNSLLNISRIESGRIIIDPKPTVLSELVEGIVNDLKAKTEEKQQTLIVSVHKDLPKVNLDPHLIGQVYMNFLTNAIKYTPKGGEISVFISRKGEELVSQITDTGYGIPKEQHARVFQKFFRAENIVKVETDGTGLGLYLVKAIIESSGGKVWFESAEGKGTTFWFTLPMSGMKAKEGEVTLDG